MKINRRQFTLGSTTLLLSGMLPLKVNSSMLDNKKNLVVIMLRGHGWINISSLYS